MKPVRNSEYVDDGVVEALSVLRLPGIFRRIYAWYWRYIRKDPLYASLIEVWREKTTEEYFALIARREGYREKWFDMWNENQLDFVLTVPNSLPAVPHGGMKYGWSACGYTFLFNIVSCPICYRLSFTETLSSSTTLLVFYLSHTSTKLRTFFTILSQETS